MQKHVIIRRASVPFWTNINADRVCSGKEVRVFSGMHANMIGGTLDRPLVQVFYPRGQGPAYAWMNPGDVELVDGGRDVAPDAPPRPPTGHKAR